MNIAATICIALSQPKRVERTTLAITAIEIPHLTRFTLL